MRDDLFHSDAPSATTRTTRGASDDFRKPSVTLALEVLVHDAAGVLKSRSVTNSNLRTNVGADFFNTQLWSTGAAGAQANWIALTTDSTAPALGDTTLASEETLNGLARAQATDTHTGSATTATLSKTFTYSGSSQKILAKVGLFTASSSGTMVLETLLSSTATVNANGDQVTINWTVTF